MVGALPEQASEQPQRRRRGRRPGGADTRAQLLDAARLVFAERGYEGATVRTIAERAGVDPAMVNHWFGGKEALFTASLELPVSPVELFAEIIPGDPEQLAERIIRRFLTIWDATGGGPLAALLQSISGHEGAAQMMREFITTVMVGRIIAAIPTDRKPMRAALCGSQLFGLGMVRYVLKLEPLASADHDTVVAAIGPALQRYLTGSIT